MTYHKKVEDMVKICDVVTINCPLHPETENLFNKEMLYKMKRGAYIVNTARGKIMDRNAVAAALAEGQLAGYAGMFSEPHFSLILQQVTFGSLNLHLLTTHGDRCLTME